MNNGKRVKAVKIISYLALAIGYRM